MQRAPFYTVCQIHYGSFLFWYDFSKRKKKYTKYDFRNQCTWLGNGFVTKTRNKLVSRDVKYQFWASENEMWKISKYQVWLYEYIQLGWDSMRFFRIPFWFSHLENWDLLLSISNFPSKEIALLTNIRNL